ncbi:MAG TPA: hypothetical protein VLF14_07535 [Candidatus Binatia bacterium]|nr:hypothetical protein [Candidatus Binatia bacterium]
MAKRMDGQLAGILKALRAEVSPLRTRGVTLVVDFVLARPVRDFVDPEGLIRLLVDSLQSESLVQVIRDRAPRIWSRHVGRSRRQRLPLAAALPEKVRSRLREVVAATRPPPGRWTRNAVDPVLVRKLIAPVIQDVLLAFTRELPLPVFGSGLSSWPGIGTMAALSSRVREEIGRRAGQVADAGRAVLGGIGIDLEGQIEVATREFSQTAERGFREALAKRIETAEGRALLGEIQGQVLDRLLAARFDELHEDVESLPWSELAELAAPALDHLRRQPFVGHALREEIDAWLATDGGRPLRTLLDELGLLGPVRRHALSRADELARKLFASTAFARWLAALLGSRE